jgi:hypothetical protein
VVEGAAAEGEAEGARGGGSVDRSSEEARPAPAEPLGDVMRPETRELMRRAQAQGWIVQYTGSNHLKWRAPTGEIAISANTDGDKRSIKNHLARMKRMGFRVE